MSQIFIKQQILKKDIFADEHIYFQRLHNDQRIGEIEAVELTFKKFPSLQENLDGGIASQQNLEATPTQRELNHYVTDMAPFYQDIKLG